jgi:hypothetical protein
LDKAIIERIPYEPREAEISETYDYIRDLIREEHRQPLRSIRDSLLELNEQIGIIACFGKTKFMIRGVRR